MQTSVLLRGSGTIDQPNMASLLERSERSKMKPLKAYALLYSGMAASWHLTDKTGTRTVDPC